MMVHTEISALPGSHGTEEAVGSPGIAPGVEVTI